MIGGQQQREHVRPRRSQPAPALVDQLEDQLVGAARAVRSKRPDRSARRQHPVGGAAPARAGFSVNARISVSSSRSCVQLGALLQPEHGAQDDLERQAAADAGAARSPDRGARRPPPARPARPSGPDRRCMRSPWKAGSISLRCSRCGSSSSRITECAADERLEQAGALARVQDVGRRHEQLFDLVGVGQHDERRLAEQADREALAVARACSAPRGRGTGPRADRL